MKSFAEHILNEVGDAPMAWYWSEWGEVDGVTTAFSDEPRKMFVAVAETRTRPIPRPNAPRAAKRYVKVTFGEHAPGQIIVGFVTHDEYDNPTDAITGLGDAVPIFSTVQDIIRAFVKRFGKENIKVLRIDGRKEGRGNVSRTKLYGRFAKKFAQEIGGKVVKSDTSSREIFDIQLAEKNTLLEVGDSPYPWKWTTKPSSENLKSGKENIAEAEISSKNDPGMRVYFTRSPMEGIGIEASFETKDAYGEWNDGLTGQGDAFRIFATAQSVIEAFFKEYGPIDFDYFIFYSAKVVKKRKGPPGPYIPGTRSKIYGRWAKKFTNKIGGKLSIEDAKAYTIFKITFPKDVKENTSLIENYKNFIGFDEKVMALKKKYADEVWDMLQTSYADIGGLKGNGFQSKEKMLEIIPFWKIFTRGNKLIMVAMYKDKQGRKGVAYGTDGSEDAKIQLAKTFKADLNKSYAELNKRALGFVLKNIEYKVLKPYFIIPSRVQELLKDDAVEIIKDLSNKSKDIVGLSVHDIKVWNNYPQHRKHFYIRDIGGERMLKLALGTSNVDIFKK